MNRLGPKRLSRLSLDNQASASIGKAVIEMLDAPADSDDRILAGKRFMAWRALARRLAPEHWQLLSTTLGWPAPPEDAFNPVVPENLRDFRVHVMPNRMIAAHVLVGRTIRATLASRHLNDWNSDERPLARICFGWIDQICTDDEIIDIHLATGYMWRLDLMSDGGNVKDRWPDFDE